MMDVIVFDSKKKEHYVLRFSEMSQVNLNAVVRINYRYW